jgi:hypothetical protein
MNTEEQLSRPILHPEEPVDELTYVSYSHQNFWAVNIQPNYLFLCTTLTQVISRILRILISLSLTLWLTAHLTRCRSQRLMTLTYFREISRNTLSWWVKWPSIRVLVPPVSNMRLLTRRRMIQAPTDARHERSHREIQPRDTYNSSLIRRMFPRDCSLYFILFERMYFIFFIYDLKFNFSYLWFK